MNRYIALLIVAVLALPPMFAYGDGIYNGGTGGGGGGGTGTVKAIYTGCQATGGAITVSGTISTQLLNSANSPSSGGGYTMQATDGCTNLVLGSGYTGTLAIPGAATTGFGNGTYFTVDNEAGVNVPVSITSSTLNGFSALNLGPGTTLSFNSNGTNYFTSAFQGAVSLLTGSSTGNTLTPYSGYFVCTGTCTVTPPIPAPGYQFCIQDAVATSGVITIANPGSGTRFTQPQPGGTASAYGTATTGTLSSAGAYNDMACLEGLDATHYLTPTYVGTWTASWLFMRDLRPSSNDNTPVGTIGKAA